MKIYILVGILFLVLVGIVLGITSRRDAVIADCPSCNVILISIDTLGAKHLGVYGYDRQTSPAIDVFFKRNGIIVKHGIAAAPWTLPSHAALFASRLPSDLRVETPADAIAPETVLLPEVLQRHGWYTKAIANSFVSEKTGFNQGFDEFFAIPHWDNAEAVFSNAIEWLSTPKEQPFFFFIHTFEVHDPYESPAPFNELFNHSPAKPVDIGQIVQSNTRPDGWKKEEQQAFIRAYDQEIRYTDKFVGALLDTLQKQKLLEKTIIILTSDHGEEFGEHGILGFHSYSLYDELIRVPLLFYFPGSRPGTVDVPVSLMDIGPTLLDILSLPASPDFQGTPLRPLLSLPPRAQQQRIVQSQTRIEKNMLLANIQEYYKRGIEANTFAVRTSPLPASPAVAARSADWKLIRTLSGTMELYHLTEDPDEQHNLFEQRDSLSPKDKETVSLLMRSLGLAAL